MLEIDHIKATTNTSPHTKFGCHCHFFRYCNAIDTQRIFVMSKSTIGLLILIICLTLVSPAQAYLDPGSGSGLLSIIIGFFVAIGLTIKTYWYKLKSLYRKRSRPTQATLKHRTKMQALTKMVPFRLPKPSRCRMRQKNMMKRPAMMSPAPCRTAMMTAPWTKNVNSLRKQLRSSTKTR